MSLHMVWIEFDDHQLRRRAFGQRGDDVLDGGLGGEFDRRVGETQPFGAQSHLGDRFLAGDIDGTLARLRQRRGDLNQQRRLADAGVAAKQQHRSAHEAAAGDAIEFGDSGGEARGVLAFAGQRLERKASSFAWRAAGRGRTFGAFLGDGVPLTAGVALALPATVDARRSSGR